ncbi:MAG: bifunctional RNase H/acid phosphatase [Frankiaceae bacterium]
MTRRLVIEADGGSRGNPGLAGYGAVVRDAGTGEVLAEVAGGIGRATNNVAEYHGLLAGLRAAADWEPSAVEVRMDSKLVVEQMSGRWQVKHPAMRVLARQAFDLVGRLPAVTFRHIPREQNRHADRLANEAMDAAARGRAWVREAPEAPRPAAADPASQSYGWRTETGPATVAGLLRHGATALTAEKRFSGSGEVDLAPLGEQQAQAVAARLATEPGFAAVLSSPLTRARHTAQIAAEALGLDVVVEDGLRETDFGDWEGCSFAEVSQSWPAELAAWLASPDVAPPNGESFTATARRVRQARNRILTRFGGERVLAVSHVTPIKTLARIALDAPPQALYRMQLDPVGLTEISWYADGPAVLHRWNDAAHLPLPLP